MINEELTELLNKSISDIDMNKFGWLNKASKRLNISYVQTKKFVEKYYTGNFYERNNKQEWDQEQLKYLRENYHNTDNKIFVR